MKEFMSEEELNEVAGGFDSETGWDFAVTCSCGYTKHFKSFREAVKALMAHTSDGHAHNCHLDFNNNSNKPEE